MEIAKDELLKAKIVGWKTYVNRELAGLPGDNEVAENERALALIKAWVEDLYGPVEGEPKILWTEEKILFRLVSHGRPNVVFVQFSRE